MFTIIVPAYNEEKHIGSLIKKLKKYSKNIIVVDDGSTDRTFEIAKKQGVIVIRHIVNLGKGAAMKTGIEKAMELGVKKVIFIDADNQHDPSEIPLFEKKIRKGYKIVQGVRRFDKSTPYLRKIGNNLISFIFYLLFGKKIEDTQSGYKAIDLSVYDKIKWKSDDYFVETEILARAVKNRIKVGQVPIKTIYLDKYKGMSFFSGLEIGLKILGLRLII